jgi:hypothetical protein
MRNLFLILLVCSLSSCGIFRKVHKSTSMDKIESSSVAKLDSTSITIDKSLKTVKESIDTAVKIPGKVITEERPLNMDSLINGMTAVKNDLIDVKLILDPLTKVLTTVATIKPQLVPVILNRQTTTQNDILNTGTVSKFTEQKSKEQHKASEVDKLPANSYIFPVVIVGIALSLIIGVYRFYKK